MSIVLATLRQIDSKVQYDNAMKHLKGVDLSKIVETEDETDLAGEIACGADGCEIK